MARGRPRLRIAMAALALVVTAVVPALARHPGGETSGAPGAPGAFDYYLLSLGVAPSFCAATPANRAKEECRGLTAAAYRRTPLTLHGLWPNRAEVSVNLQPHDCDGPPFRLPSPQQAAALDRFMPGGAGLLRYEWRKHGACSGLSETDYVAALLRLAERVDATIGAALREDGLLGRPVPTAALLRAVAARDPAMAASVIVDCRRGRGGEATMITEIRLTLARDFDPIPARGVGLGQNSGCPREGGFLPAGPLP